MCDLECAFGWQRNEPVGRTARTTEMGWLGCHGKHWQWYQLEFRSDWRQVIYFFGFQITLQPLSLPRAWMKKKNDSFTWIQVPTRKSPIPGAWIYLLSSQVGMILRGFTAISLKPFSSPPVSFPSLWDHRFHMISVPSHLQRSSFVNRL